jgi:hypothetical protein
VTADRSVPASVDRDHERDRDGGRSRGGREVPSGRRIAGERAFRGARGTPLKLQCTTEDAVYATRYRTVLRASPGEGVEELGRLPVPPTGVDGVRYRALTGRWLKPLAQRVVGHFPSVNVWHLDGSRLLATASRWVFASPDGGRSWSVTLELPPSSGTMGVLPSAVCHHEGTTYLGEYPLRTSVTPKIWSSDDCGRTWSVRCELPDVRHVHAIEADPYTGDVWVTTGDADAASRIGRLDGDRFRAVGGGDQRWRAVQPVFTPEAVYWGMDSVYADEQGIYELDRDDVGSGPFDDSSNPPITRVRDLSGSVYYGATVEIDAARWIAFSTAAEVGGDRTAPDGAEGSTDRVRVLVASDASGYRDWHELASYERRSGPLRRLPLADRLPAANAYAFLAAHPDGGLCVNPSNTARRSGEIRRYPPAALDRLP